MSTADVSYIQSSFNVWLEDNFSGNIHWDGVENPNDAVWIEPWLNITYDLTRPRERVFTLDATVNCFAKRGESPDSVSTYAVTAIASEIADLMWDAEFSIARYGSDERVIGCGRLGQSEVVNLGTTTVGGSFGAGIALQQWTVSATGSVAPLI